MRTHLPDQAVPGIIIVPVTQFMNKWRVVQQPVDVFPVNAGPVCNLSCFDPVMTADHLVHFDLDRVHGTDTVSPFCAAALFPLHAARQWCKISLYYTACSCK